MISSIIYLTPKKGKLCTKCGLLMSYSYIFNKVKGEFFDHGMFRDTRVNTANILDLYEMLCPRCNHAVKTVEIPNEENFNYKFLNKTDIVELLL